MKKLFPVVALIVLAACSKQIENQMPADTLPSGDILSRDALDASIKKQVLEKGKFDWNKASNLEVWSALQQSDKALAVGFQPSGYSGDLSLTIQDIDINNTEWKNAGEQVMEMVFLSEKKSRPSLNRSEIIAYKENTLPVLYLLVSQKETIDILRQSGMVRYTDPMGYHPENTGLFGTTETIASMSSSGCGSNVAEPGLSSPADFTNITPGAKQSWNYGFHNIPQAWASSTGTGRKVMVIDTGLSPNQSLFGSLLNSGFSSGRTVERRVTLRKSGFLGFGYGSVERSTDDECGHGTSMAGAALSPRNSSGGMVGVAYNANLVSVRASADVLINESRENKGVADALVLAGNRSDVQIVSMSIGNITSNNNLRDAVNYAYNRGKLIFAAAGSSFGWSAGWFGVVFPANMSNVRAVTGIQDDGSRCNACHQGNEVDFVVVMEKDSNGRTPLSTAQSGTAPSTVGGSSVATATTSAIAALVWSANPGLSREQVVSKMITSSSNYPGRSSNFGWGLVNANTAVQ
jgi:hypothetical protein